MCDKNINDIDDEQREREERGERRERERERFSIFKVIRNQHLIYTAQFINQYSSSSIHYIVRERESYLSIVVPIARSILLIPFGTFLRLFTITLASDCTKKTSPRAAKTRRKFVVVNIVLYVCIVRM